MPGRARKQVERLSFSKSVARLLKVLNEDERYRVAGWSKFVRRLEDDLRDLQDRRSRVGLGQHRLPIRRRTHTSLTESWVCGCPTLESGRHLC